MSKEVRLDSYGEVLGPRVLGEQIRNEVIALLENKGVDFVVFDLRKVKSISSGFSHELFGKLWLQYKSDFGKRVRFMIGDSNEQKLVRTVINIGIDTAMKQL